MDDYTPGRYARTKLLQQAGFTVREAATGTEALQLVAEHNPPLILLDVNLPDMSGFEVCRQIRHESQDHAPPPSSHLRHQHSGPSSRWKAWTAAPTATWWNRSNPPS